MTVWLSFIALISGTGLALWRVYFPAAKHIKERLTSNKPYRDARARDLRFPGIARLYEGLLEGALKKLAALMGLSWSPRAFGVCLTFSLLYSVLFLIVSWGFAGGSSRIGRTALLPDWSPAERFLFCAAILAYLLLLYVIVRRLGRWAQPLGQTIKKRGPVLAFALAGGATIAGGIMLFGALVPIFLLGALSGTTVGILAVAGTTVGIAAITPWAGAWAVGAAALAGVVLSNLATMAYDLDVQVLILFWVLLPLTNALWDWFSWWVSRELGEHLLETIRRPDLGAIRKALSGLAHAAVDFALGIAILVLLARTLPWAVEQFNNFISSRGGTAPFELNDYLCVSARAPWSDGFWAALMLLSTLFPTLLHAVAALANPLAAGALWLQKNDCLAARLETAGPNSGAFEAAVDDAAAHLAMTWIAVWVLAALLVIAAFFGLIWLCNLITGELPEPLPGSLREGLLGIALWDVAAAKACLAAAALGGSGAGS